MEPSCVWCCEIGFVVGTFLKMYVEKETRKSDCCLEVDATPSFVTDAVHALTAKEQQLTPEVQVNA